MVASPRVEGISFVAGVLGFLFAAVIKERRISAKNPAALLFLREYSSLGDAFLIEKPHTLPWLGPRSRKSGVLRAFCEGWIPREN